MLKIRGKPIIEWIIINAKKQGFENFFIITNYLSEVIEKYFKSEKKFGVKIKIIKENNFLGTFGGLIYLKKFLNTDFVLTNGDIVSEIKFDEILDFHKKSESDATMAVQINLHEIPFGIVQTNGSKIIKITEKPTQKNYINAGVYSFKPSVLKYLKTKNFINTTDFFNLLLKKKKKVNAFALHEDWIDIGIKENFDNLN
jgi:NDP-sugar pyrophosphorylase family protein